MKSTKSLLSKISSRAIQFFSRHIPYNSKYKPLGVKNLLPNSSSSIEYLEIRPSYVSTLNFPSKFIEDCSSFTKPVMSVRIPGDYIVTIKDGRVYSCDPSNMAIISGENYLIDEVSFQWIAEGDQVVGGNHNKLFKLKGLKKPRKYAGKVFSLLGGGGAKYYYYHWVIDSIAKLGLLKESGKFDEVDFFLVPSYQTRYHKEYLDHFGITADKIIIEDNEPHIQAEYLMVTSYVQVQFHHPKWACDFLYDSFIPSDFSRKQDKLIYIPRGDAAINRKVLNERELMEALINIGFEIHYLAEMAVPDEAKLLNAARLVVGVQGSGFANLVFCQPGTKVLEIFPETYVRHIDYDICNKKGLEFHYLICPSDGIAVDTVEGQKINLTADVSAITSKIKSILNLH